MKIDYADIEKILSKLDTWGFVILLAWIVFALIIFIYLKQYFKSAAEESYNKAIESFKTELAKSLQTQMGLFFRDESVRNNLLQTIGIKSFDKKIECWQATYSTYFAYQNSWSFHEQTDIKDYTDLDKTLNDLRTRIFNETVYLGPELSQKLIRLNSLMREGLRLKRTEFAYSGRNYQLSIEAKLQANLDAQHTNEQRVTELLQETELWLMAKLHSDQTVEKFEFSKEHLEKIRKEREKQFDAIGS